MDGFTELKRYLLAIFSVVLVAFLTSACAPKKPPLPITILNPQTAEEMRKEEGYWIEVQIPQRKIVLARGNHIIKSFPIAVGMPSYPTPVDIRSINRIVWNPWWYPPKGSDWVEDPAPVPPRSAENPLGEIKMPLGKSYLIHGTRAIYSIGQWASHGCIRMISEDIFAIAQLLMSEYSKTSAIDAMERANRNPQTEFEIKLEKEIPVFLNYDLVKIDNGFVSIAPDFYKQQENLPAYIAEAIRPHLKRKMEPNLKKIKQVLRVFRTQTVTVPLEGLTTGGY